MLNHHVQQWSAIQTVRAARLTHDDIMREYIDAGGETDEIGLRGYLTGLTTSPALERDLIAQVINELLDLNGLLTDGAHYSSDGVAADSGYSDYLRALVLSPDAYDFAATPAGDHSTSTVRPPNPFGSVTSASGQVGSMGAPDAEEQDTGAEDDDVRRCHALYESGMLESGQESRFDRITARARDHFGVSSASIALITEDSQIIKSVLGPIGQDLPRGMSLCATTIEEDRTLVVNDASTDPAWRHHPLVTHGPNIRFYAGHPLSTIDGWRIGTLCLIDDKPRDFTENDRLALRVLANEAQTEIWVGP